MNVQYRAKRYTMLFSDLKPGALFLRGQSQYLYMKLANSAGVVELQTGNIREWKTDCEVEIVDGYFTEGAR